MALQTYSAVVSQQVSKDVLITSHATFAAEVVHLSWHLDALVTYVPCNTNTLKAQRRMTSHYLTQLR